MSIKLKSPLKKAIVLCAFMLSFLLGNITGWFVHPVWAADEPPEFSIFWEAWDIVLNHFVEQDKIDFRRMTYGAIQGMLDTLGDQNHTVFFDPETAKMQENALEGSFEGIGAHVAMKDNQFTIVAPIRGSPAEAAGIQAGDVVTAVDGQPIEGLTESDIINKVRGPAGTTVVLTIFHPNADRAVDITVVRGRIELESVSWAPIPGSNFAYLQIQQFSADTNFELMRVLREIRDDNADHQPIQGIVLDLRNNPGGYLHEAIRAGSQFLENGSTILHERDAQGNIVTHKAQGPGLARDLPMVVLINQGSASAAEILAGALQENNRAQLVGETTLGTGTVLQAFTLSDGSVIRLGVTNWLTPEFHLIKNQGIQPTIGVAQDSSVQLVDALQLREMATQNPGTTVTSEDKQFNMAIFLLRLALLTEK